MSQFLQWIIYYDAIAAQLDALGWNLPIIPIPPATNNDLQPVDAQKVSTHLAAAYMASKIVDGASAHG